MTYTKESVDKLKFKCNSHDTIYTIDLSKHHCVTWLPNNSMYYSMEEILNSLNSGLWNVTYTPTSEYFIFN